MAIATVYNPDLVPELTPEMRNSTGTPPPPARSDRLRRERGNTRPQSSPRQNQRGQQRVFVVNRR